MNEKQPPRLKCVVRKLPARLPKEVFLAAAAAWVNDETIEWMSYVEGKVPKNTAGKPVVQSRAYLLFKSHEQLVAFHREFHGHAFVDRRQGKENRAVVEYAPNQRVPRPDRHDAKQSTIDKEPEYIAFLEALADPSKQAPVADVEDAAPPMSKTTPLLQYLKEKKTASASHSKKGKKDKDKEKAKAKKKAKDDKGKSAQSDSVALTGAGAATEARMNDQRGQGQGQGQRAKRRGRGKGSAEGATELSDPSPAPKPTPKAILANPAPTSAAPVQPISTPMPASVNGEKEPRRGRGRGRGKGRGRGSHAAAPS